MSEIFEEKPRWPGAPPICLEANLPAFETEKDARDFHDRNGPSCHMEKPYLCRHCGCFHYHSTAPSPSGETSGTSRYHTSR